MKRLIVTVGVCFGALLTHPLGIVGVHFARK